ncbi:PINIT domain-containing protein [Thelonectria olida]|uniref:PINIT domain-containing protein n=1 Tax=Thelonectria olida TaxID=1576542 RepID=A0A9P9ASL5_9HYPO|nr:PINIT domain-containing protein [Thelonectria olida]
MASTSGLGSASIPGSNYAVSVTRQEATGLVRQVSRLLNRQLSSICQVNGLKSTGIKAELQKRIGQLIEEALRANDGLRFQQIRQSIHNVMGITPAPDLSSPRTSYNLGPSATHANAHTTPRVPQSMAFNGYSLDSRSSQTPHQPPAASRLHINFRWSPFYKIENTIGDVRICEAMSQHRNSVVVPLHLHEHSALQKCIDDPSYRIMVFCSGDNGAGVQNIAFPHQSELRINGGDIKANLRGLKNKPGSTRPVDITGSLRLKASYDNKLEFTYALTTKKFYLVVNLCKVTTVEQLVAQIADGRKIMAESVRREFAQKNQDPDVVATSQVLSLKCPLSYMRLNIPCRGLSCSHIQCFDATSYLQLQEQGPQWLCPICNKSTVFDHLAVDNYVREILDNTPKDVDTVTIEPDGRWFVKNEEERRNEFGSQGARQSHFDDDDDDDDDLEISEVNIISRRLETPRNASFSSSTPASGSRGPPSVGPRGIASTSAKRPAAAVIDLTLSSDDEDEPLQRAPKRQNTGTNGFTSGLEFPNGAHGYPS